MMQAYSLDTVDLARLLFGVAAAVLQWGVGLFGFSIARQYAVDARWFSASTAILGWMTLWTALSQALGAEHPWTRVMSQLLSGYGSATFLFLVCTHPSKPAVPTGSSSATVRSRFERASAPGGLGLCRRAPFGKR